MGFFDSHEENFNQFQSGNPPHESKLSHELIAGAASFAAMRAYEKHEEANGKPASHELMKELFAGFAGAEADKMFETHGLNEWDKAKVKFENRKNAAKFADSQY